MHQQQLKQSSITHITSQNIYGLFHYILIVMTLINRIRIIYMYIEYNPSNGINILYIYNIYNVKVINMYRYILTVKKCINDNNIGRQQYVFLVIITNNIERNIPKYNPSKDK